MLGSKASLVAFDDELLRRFAGNYLLGLLSGSGIDLRDLSIQMGPRCIGLGSTRIITNTM